MAIIVDSKTRIVVQGITGNQGRFHTVQMLAYGSRVVAGVSPGRSGQVVEGVPVYDTVFEAAERQEVNASVIFVPAAFAKDAALEAIDAGLSTVVIITEHIPLQDTLEILARARQKGTCVVGPNTFGIISPGLTKLGIMPNQMYSRGPVGIAARSGTLSYEIAAALTWSGLGQSTAVGLGGDRVVGLSFTDVLERFEADPDTRAVVLVGEIGGTAEEEASEYVRQVSKPVVAYLAGKSAPPGKRMGHAGAIIERGRGSYESKREALLSAGARVADVPWEIPKLVMAAMG